MRKFLFVAVPLVIAACTSNVVSGPGDVDDGGLSPTSDGGLASDDAAHGELDGATGDSAADGDSNFPSADAGDAGDDANIADVDAAGDAGQDATLPDAASDAGSPIVQDAGSDAGSDGGPPLKCTTGATRCKDYQLQTCEQDGSWTWEMGDQSCCHDSRFVVDGWKVRDIVTGLVWNRGVAQTSVGAPPAGADCATELPGSRVPTVAEMLTLVIGPPVNNISVCSPTVDQTAFVGATSSITIAIDGCVDLTRGTSDPCTKKPQQYFCVKGP